MQQVQGKSGRGVNLITYLPLRLRSKISGAMSPLPIRPYNMHRDNVQSNYFILYETKKKQKHEIKKFLLM